MKRLLVRTLKAMIFSLLLLSSIEGQSKSAAVTGSVLDQNGAVIPGAKVSLRRAATDEIFRKATTNNDGVFSFYDVSPGDYEIEVSTDWIGRSFRKRVAVYSSQAAQSNIVLHLEPCFEEPEFKNKSPLTGIDRSDIVREIVDLRFRKLDSQRKLDLSKVIFSSENIDSDWLRTNQKENITVMSRSKIQDITEKSGRFMYYSVSKMVQRGACVSVSLYENWTVQGQPEDANMAGGATVFEFRKVSGRWVGLALMSWVA